MNWIDTHVHLFPENGTGPVLAATGTQNTVEAYYKTLGKNSPKGVVVVDFSMAENSSHVINSLDLLKNRGVKAAGVIRGNLQDGNTLTWLQRPDVKGIRLYTRESVPDVSGQKWHGFFTSLAQDKKHILIFGQPANTAALIANIPADITILVDHLGMPDISGEDAGFASLLILAKKRGNVYFKGPGYRTSLDVSKVKPVLARIIDNVGEGRVMLGASDAPFAGPVPGPSGQKFAEVMDYNKVLEFIDELASGSEKMLEGNAREVYFPA